MFVSIGATIARMLGLKSVRFYENGVISMNLPVCAQVVGGRATRTTHPKVMKGFQDIISLIADEPFIIENPFIWKTKAEVIDVITKADCADLIAHSMTCTHTWDMSNQHTHCGGCSQCIDRRFAIVAAKADQHDPPEHYKVNVFTESRDKGEDKIMAAAYLERANQVKGLADITQFISSYPDVGRVFKYLNCSTGQAAQRVFDLYKRHSNEVMGALKELLKRHSDEILERTLPGDCLLRIAYESGSVISTPTVVSIEKQPENFFRKRGAIWEARFQGRNTILLRNIDKGAEYINLLLAYPERLTSIYEIMCGCALSAATTTANISLDHDDIEEGFQVTSGVPLGDAGVVADRIAVNQYNDRYCQLLREQHEAKEEGDHERQDKIQDEILQIAAAVSGAVGRGGKLRKMADKRKNLRDSFRNSVNRAIKQIEKYDKPLAEHLKTTIQHGNEAVYRPKMSISWEVRPIVNM